MTSSSNTCGFDGWLVFVERIHRLPVVEEVQDVARNYRGTALQAGRVVVKNEFAVLPIADEMERTAEVDLG